jgi:type III restriction enzyme
MHHVASAKRKSNLFEKGIKVLSLFFIDSVEKYRLYDETGEQALGEYAKYLKKNTTMFAMIF